MVLEFIEQLKPSEIRGRYAFAAAVCGDEAGNSMKLLERSLLKAGLKLDSAFSVTMPNNYIVLFDVDSKETEQKKLAAAEKTIDRIAETASAGKTGVFEIYRGTLPGIKTAVIGTLFNRFGISTKGFYAEEKCTGCGICERVCCCGSITVSDGKPRWASACTQCLACVHYCPVKAVQCGPGTKNKGRYVNPNVDLKDMLKR
jgi:ferredoxin